LLPQKNSELTRKINVFNNVKDYYKEVNMFGLGAQELLLILLVVLLLFGAKRIPEIARGLGKGMSEFKKAMHETQNELTKVEPPAETKKPAEDKKENPAT
jgi:sec-independent protein translocase protein TatA